MPSSDLKTHPVHEHLFLGAGHDQNERRTWVVIILCGLMMLLEIVGGLMFGSIALVADGLHMSTHAGALFLAALAYTLARRYAADRRFTFGTGKLGDLAGFSSAIVLAMIALFIGVEAVGRLLAPVPIHFGEAIPIACLGLLVNVASAWLLSGGGHDHAHGHGHHHGHGHGHDHGHDHDAHDESHRLETADGPLDLEICEDGVPPRFRLTAERADGIAAGEIYVETVRPDGSRQRFAFRLDGDSVESVDEIPEPHEFVAEVHVRGTVHAVSFAEHEHGTHHRDNNMRAAVVHVIADAAVSVLVIAGLVLAKLFGWLWMDPVAGLIGAGVIASWSYGLLRDTGAILLDMTPDARLGERIRTVVEAGRDHVCDLHVWRLGPGHLGAIVSIVTDSQRDTAYYYDRLAGLPSLSHLTVEIHHR